MSSGGKKSQKKEDATYVTRHDGLYRAFQAAVSKGKRPTANLYLGALSRLPGHSESDFPTQFIKKYWESFVADNSDHVQSLRQDAEDSRFIEDGELKRFNADIVFPNINTKGQTHNLVHPMNKSELKEYCEANGITMPGKKHVVKDDDNEAAAKKNPKSSKMPASRRPKKAEKPITITADDGNNENKNGENDDKNDTQVVKTPKVQEPKTTKKRAAPKAFAQPQRSKKVKGDGPDDEYRDGDEPVMDDDWIQVKSLIIKVNNHLRGTTLKDDIKAALKENDSQVLGASGLTRELAKEIQAQKPSNWVFSPRDFFFTVQNSYGSAEAYIEHVTGLDGEIDENRPEDDTKLEKHIIGKIVQSSLYHELYQDFKTSIGVRTFNEKLTIDGMDNMIETARRVVRQSNRVKAKYKKNHNVYDGDDITEAEMNDLSEDMQTFISSGGPVYNDPNEI
ncbi:hypothetical protein F4801DRAFT_603625 [Xylaria longipes]|nr:hypothetical protein F4801DRAFT_603625 [Xylaria longipes]